MNDEAGDIMSNPFTIHIFSTTGDPDGIRIIHKSNWSGVGVVFPRSSLKEVLNEEDAQNPGVYILVGALAEETIYIGEADPISARLKQHLKKDWSWGIFFVDSHGLGKTEIKFLESELVKIAQKEANSILMNRNAPNRPNMTRQSKAAANVFLQEMLLILPMIGINAFTKSRDDSISFTQDSSLPKVDESNDSDTIVVPARPDGFKAVFIGEDQWYAIRINAREIPKFKYIAAYQVAPISAITYIAEIKEILPYRDSGKYVVKFKDKATPLENPVKLQKGKLGSAPQGPRHTVYEKLINARHLHQLWE